MIRNSYLENPWVWILGGAVIGAWLNGAIHSLNAHRGTGTIVAFLFPPFGIYMSIEHLTGHRGSQDMSTGPGIDADGGYMRQCLERRVMTTQSGLSRMQNEVFCTCTADLLARLYPIGEAEYVAEHGQNSSDFLALRQATSESCLIGARYIGAQDSE